MTKVITIGFSPHRIETLPFAYSLMKEHEIIILEEPFNGLFYQFLEDKISLEDYIKNTSYGFPEFVKRSALILKNLYKEKKKILQIDPYLEKVGIIQKSLAQDKDIKEFLQNSEFKQIYELENKVMGKLLEFYETSLCDNFNKIIESVKAFSKADAERFRLRDRLRAKEILKNLPKQGKVYIEAGTIHIYLKKLLHIYLNKDWKIQHKFLLENFLKPLIGKAYIFPPGELLTLRYILKRKENPEVENLLAARSLIYIKMIPKEELSPTVEDPCPHLRRELKAIQMVNKLSFRDCAELYRILFFIKDNKRALKIVEEFIKKFYKDSYSENS